jgi:hypothetical protein
LISGLQQTAGEMGSSQEARWRIAGEEAGRQRAAHGFWANCAEPAIQVKGRQQRGGEDWAETHRLAHDRDLWGSSIKAGARSVGPGLSMRMSGTNQSDGGTELPDRR